MSAELLLVVSPYLEICIAVFSVYASLLNYSFQSLTPLIAETYNETLSVIEEPWAGSLGLLQTYNRPQYLYTGGIPGFNASDLLLLLYSGNR